MNNSVHTGLIYDFIVKEGWQKEKCLCRSKREPFKVKRKPSKVYGVALIEETVISYLSVCSG